MRTIRLNEILESHEIFDFVYSYTDKAEFEARFIDEYIMEDIGFGTVDMFMHRLRVEVQRLAPHYDRQYNLLNDLTVELERGAKIIETSTDQSEDSREEETTTSGDNVNYSQEMGNVTVGGVVFDNINDAMKSVIENVASGSGSLSHTATGTRETENVDIPLHEAIGNIKAIKTDVTYDFISALRSLFSYIVW